MRVLTEASLPAPRLRGHPETQTADKQSANKNVEWQPSEAISREQWALTGVRFGAMSRLSNFLLGDWLCFGKTRWAVGYAEAAKITGYDIKTLYKLAHVASKVPIFLRRKNLTWSHHELVAALEQDDQRYWLDEAERLKWSVDDLRLELRSSKRSSSDEGIGGSHVPGGSSAQLKSKLTPERRASSLEVTDVIVCPKCGEHLTAANALRQQ